VEDTYQSSFSSSSVLFSSRTLPWAMMVLFALFLVVLFLVAIFLRYSWRLSTTNRGEASDLFKKFQRRYLVILLFSTGADWIQGPYIYALYETYGLSKSDIAVLFLSGYLSSMLFGTFIGSLADKVLVLLCSPSLYSFFLSILIDVLHTSSHPFYFFCSVVCSGRKRLSMCYALFYACSCFTTLGNNFDVLLLGRVLQGISVSLLHTVFEAWMVQEHIKQAGSQEGLAKTLSEATWMNGIVAIFAGFLAKYVAQKYGFVAPFMTSAVVLVFVLLLVYSSWHENYGDADLRLQLLFTTAASDLRRDLKLPLLGLIQSFFEGAVNIFIFMWTPALLDDKMDGDPPPYSMIFTAFMACTMIGSASFLPLLKKTSAENIARIVLVIAAVALLIPYFTSVGCVSCFPLISVDHID
jgi:MFS family permease